MGDLLSMPLSHPVWHLEFSPLTACGAVCFLTERAYCLKPIVVDCGVTISHAAILLDQALGSFQFGAIMKSTATNIYVQFLISYWHGPSTSLETCAGAKVQVGDIHECCFWNPE